LMEFFKNNYFSFCILRNFSLKEGYFKALASKNWFRMSLEQLKLYSGSHVHSAWL
jgi:hypothetical protein